MRTFNDVVSELRGKMRNATYITILKTAGMNAVILEDGEFVAKSENGQAVPVTPVLPNAQVDANAPVVEPEPVKVAEEPVVVEEPLQRTKVRKSRWNESPDEPVAEHDQE